MAEDAVATGAGEPPPPPEDVREVGRLEAWRDAKGRLWTALTGEREVWFYGPPVKIRMYPRAARITNGIVIALLSWIAWQTAAMAADLHTLVLVEINR